LECKRRPIGGAFGAAIGAFGAFGAAACDADADDALT
jgi:hypothetical protein